MQKIRNTSFIVTLFFTIVSCTSIPSPHPDAIRLACIGDSITQGSYIPLNERYNYPAQLNAFLGNTYRVKNFGVDGSCALVKSNKSYKELAEYEDSIAYNPEIVLFMLGTNDSKTYNWDKTQFKKDYKALVSAYLNIPSKPRVILMTIPPAYSNTYQIQADIIEHHIVPDIIDIHKELNLELVELDKAFIGRKDLYMIDRIHLNQKGARYLAKTVYTSITW